MGEHALLNPSGSKIWMTCTPSARAGEHIEKEESEYSAEGSTAHKLGELIINRQLKRLREQEFKVKLAQIKTNKYYNAGMYKDAQAYCAYVMSVYSKALLIDPQAIILVERKLNLSKYIPGSFGTADILIFCKGHLWFIDLKYGKGVQVDAVKNTQLMCYALGAVELANLLSLNIVKISLTIYQPRIDNISTYTTDIYDLLDWANLELAPAAQKAWKGEGEYVAGEHCRFCAVKPTCKTLKNQNSALIKKKDNDISDKEIAELILKSDQIISWLKGIKDLALKEALKGKKYPGLKLISARSDRYISDVEKAEKILRGAGYSLEEIYKTPELKGIGELEKLLGKEDFNYYLRTVVKKPYGAPALVDEKKPGEPYSKAKKAFSK